MIYESHPWRQDLLRDAEVLERWLAKPATERRSVIIEKKVFVGAYAMRRLLQSSKLSTATEGRNRPLVWFPSIKKIERTDRWRIDLHYDLQAGAPTQLAIPRLLDLIIHSFIFQEWTDEDAGETNLALTSDRTRDSNLWLIRLPAFIALMRFVPWTIPRRPHGGSMPKMVDGKNGGGSAIRLGRQMVAQSAKASEEGSGR